MSTPTCTPATKKPSRCFAHFLDDPSMVHYDGALGYEAYVCRQCGTYFDYTEGEHPPDEWSLSFVGLPKNKIEHFPVCSV